MGDTMNDTKMLLIRGMKLTALADAVGMQVSNLSKIINGQRKANLDLARKLASAADELCGMSIFDPNDFNADLSPNYQNVCDDVLIRVHVILLNVTKIITAGELLEEHSHNLNLMVALNNLVYDGVTQTWGGYLLDLQPTNQPVRW
tara:strand:- start:49 stop:486 length:438 start_codon:yes stop_codon:yes gene_type:complete